MLLKNRKIAFFTYIMKNKKEEVEPGTLIRSVII